MRRDESRAVARIVAASRVGREPADLAALARVVGEELGASRCRIAPATQPVAWTVWDGPGGAVYDSVLGEDEAAEPAESVFDVRFAGAVAGHVAVTGWVAHDRRKAGLLRDVLLVLGPVLHGAGLAGSLQEHLQAAVASANDVAEARRRAVAGMDAQRRALERDLHDGAQHHLVTLRLLVGLLEHETRTRASRDVLRDRLDAVAAQLERTDRVLSRTAAGTLPVILVTQGLVPALTAELEGQRGVTIQVGDGMRDRRYPGPVESVAYFACLEGVNNARRHAAGAAVTVSLRDEYRGLAFSVRDDGPGFDPDRVGQVSGLGHLRDRVGAVGGQVTVRSAPGRGTVIDGLIPV